MALGKPVYLFCPRGHVEQEYNLRFYLQRFSGVSCPKSRRYRRYIAGAKRVGKGKTSNITLPEGFRGRMQSLTDWEASLDGLDLSSQAEELQRWLTVWRSRRRSRLSLCWRTASGCQAFASLDAFSSPARRAAEDSQRRAP